MSHEKMTIHTDGSCYYMTREGGWAFVARVGNYYTEQAGPESDTTVNRMELTAILAGLNLAMDKAQQMKLAGVKHIEVYSDSQYSVNSILTHYPVACVKGDEARLKNGDLLKEISLLRAKLHAKKFIVTFHWIRGHAGIQDNERADALAHNARIEQKPSHVVGCYE